MPHLESRHHSLTVYGGRRTFRVFHVDFVSNLRQDTAVKVLQSLPGGIWEAYGASGWGPDGNFSFMSVDVGGVVGASQVFHGYPEMEIGSANSKWKHAEHEASAPAVRIPMNETIPRRASALFSGGSCAWANYYGDLETLEKVGKYYAKDFKMYRWYSFDSWRQKFKACLQQAEAFESSES